MTLDDLERLKRHSCRNRKVLRSPPEKKSTKVDTQCGPMIPVSRNIRYMRIFAGDQSARRLQYNKCYTQPFANGWRHSCNMCTYLFTANMCQLASWLLSSLAVWSLVRNVITWVWMKKRNVSYFSAKWAHKSLYFNSTIRPTMKSIIHHAKHRPIGTYSVVLCTIWAFWTVADVYSADVCQIMNLKAINRYI